MLSTSINSLGKNLALDLRVDDSADSSSFAMVTFEGLPF